MGEDGRVAIAITCGLRSSVRMGTSAFSSPLLERYASGGMYE